MKHSVIDLKNPVELGQEKSRPDGKMNLYTLKDMWNIRKEV